MVIPITNYQRLKMDQHCKGLIVELVGPAGGGKSTLFQALQRDAPWIHGRYNPPIWDITSSPFYIRNIISLLPVLFRIYGSGDGHLTRRQMACLALLNGWHKILRKSADNNCEIILLDQGPIFLMAYLNMFGPKKLYQPNLQGWWNKVNDQWIHNLDLIVYLDATNDILIKRIRNRRVDLLNGMSDQDANAFLSKYRTVYEQIITRFTSSDNQARLARIDSSMHSVSDLTANVIDEIEMCERRVLNLITAYLPEME